MIRLLRAIDMCSQLPLLFPKGCLLLATHRPAGEDHHNWLVPGFLPVGGTTRGGLVLLALNGAELLPPLAALFNRGYALSVVRLHLLAGPEDVLF